MKKDSLFENFDTPL